MAAGLGFKTFTTGEVLTSADVNGYLMQGVLVFASAAARNAAITSPQEGQFAFTKDTNGLWYYDGAAWVASGATGDIEGVTAGVGISGGGTSGTVTVTNDMATTITTSGDLLYGTGAGTYARRGIGSTGNVLTVSGGVPVWSAPAGGGKVLQVVQAEYSTGTTIASTTFTDTGLTASITPSASNSKVLVLVSQPAYIGYSTGSSVGASAQIVRGSTAVFVQGAGKDSLYFTIQVSGQSDLQLGQNISMIYLDSPATTSATTYKTQAAVSSTASGRNITAQYNSSKSTITLIEIGA